MDPKAHTKIIKILNKAFLAIIFLNWGSYFIYENDKLICSHKFSNGEVVVLK